MAADIPTELRILVATRANFVCEYCRMPQAYALHKHEPDHIVPRQHGGETQGENLAFACLRCNRYKGPNVARLTRRPESLLFFLIRVGNNGQTISFCATA